MLQFIDWSQVTDEQLDAWGNFPIHVELDDGTTETVVGFDWGVDDIGAVGVQRRVVWEVEGDPEPIAIAFKYKAFRPGRWVSVRNGRQVIDPEAISIERAAQRDREEQQRAAMRLGIPGGVPPIALVPPNGGPNREARRHPG